jgi:phosphate transport system substrate-binding protein
MIRKRTNKNFLLAVFIILFSCQPYFKNDESDNSPTSGILTVYTDTCLYEITRVFARTFESQYPSANISIKTACRNDLLKNLYDKKIYAILLPDSISPDEKSSFLPATHYLRFSPMVHSAITFFCKKNDSVRFRSIPTRSLSSYLSDSSQLLFYMPPSCSFVPLYLFKKILAGKSFHAGVRFTTPDSISYYVESNNKPCIGILEHCLISDRDDPRVKKFFEKFYVIPLRPPDSGMAFFPDPTNFELNRYPLRITWYYYRNAPEFSLAKGFESFMAGEQGQRLFLKYGLLPVRKPGRKIQIRYQ